eukprot:363306-Chlamydomonas_euryale.AAC.7
MVGWEGSIGQHQTLVWVEWLDGTECLDNKAGGSTTPATGCRRSCCVDCADNKEIATCRGYPLGTGPAP